MTAVPVPAHEFVYKVAETLKVGRLGGAVPRR